VVPELLGAGGDAAYVRRGRPRAGDRHSEAHLHDLEAYRLPWHSVKVCVVGAGAVGGLIGARLALAGYPTSAVARGATLDALTRYGWRLVSGEQAPVRASADPGSLGVQDLVLVAVKAPALAAAAPLVTPLIGEHTVVLPAMNGVPWWFLPGTTLRAVDPAGDIAAAIPRRRVLGCVVHFASTAPAPGVVAHTSGNGLIVGEPDGGLSGRTDAVVQALVKAGFEARASTDVRRDIWYKLWGNMTMNPISALTGATADRILDDPQVNRFCLEVMAEAAAIGARIGCPIEESGADRMAVTRRLGAFKTSMLQDAEAGRPVELDALVTVVREIGERVGVPTPSIDTLLGLSRLAARVRGLYPQPA
jgi:2-dehydropantoate 2-reductase